MLPGAYRPVTAQILGTVMAFSAAVVLLHRFFPAECIFSCEGAVLISQFVTTRLLRIEFYEKMDVSTGMQDDPFFPKTGLYTTRLLISGPS